MAADEFYSSAHFKLDGRVYAGKREERRREKKTVKRKREGYPWGMLDGPRNNGGQHWRQLRLIVFTGKLL